MGLVDGHTAHGDGLGCRVGRVGACGAGAAGSEIQPYHRGRRVRRLGLQGGGWLGEAALRVSVKLKQLLVIGRLSGVGHPRLG